MNLRGASLGRRLLVGAGVFITLALLFAAFVIGFVLHRFIQGQIDQRLDTQIVFLSSMLRADADGGLSLAGNADGPPFDRPGQGWYWRVRGPANTLSSRSLVGALPERLDIPAGPLPRNPAELVRGLGDARPIPADGPGPGGEMLHFRILRETVSGRPVEIVVTAPRAAVIGPLREAMTTLAASLVVLGLALGLAIVAQVRLGLRPLERLREAVARIRSGRSQRVPAEQPLEIRPLVDELNGLLEQNAANLERARRHVANLAHGLKTPIATLAIALSARDHDDDHELRPLLALMERRIRHHLGRARAAALNGPARSRTVIAPRLRELGEVMGKVHAERNVSLAVEVPAELAVACEQQDFDEMAGNLLDNAFKWARGRVAVHARLAARTRIELTIEDDGAGLRTDDVVQALRPGQRLDENAPGFGFGLPITRELAELYGGELGLGASALGGLAATLRLPGDMSDESPSASAT